MPEALMWVNDKVLSKIIMIHVGDRWIPRQPWAWLASKICEYHRYHRPQEWSLVGQGKSTFYVRYWQDKEKGN